MASVRPPLLLYVLAALASAFALPEWEELNPLIASLYLGLVVGAVMVAAWHGGLQVGIQAAIVGALVGNLLSFTQTGALGTSLAQFGVLMLVALVVSSWREASRRAGVAAAPAPSPATNGYRPLFEEVADAILVADGNGRCLDANRAMSTMTGYELDELQRLHAAKVIAPLRPWTPEERLRFGRDGHWRGTLAVRRRDGSVLKADARLMLLELPSGTVYLTAIGERRAGLVRPT